MASEAELVGRCLDGDRAAFGILVERYRDRAVGFCWRQTGDFEAAQDLAQELFLRAYFDLHALREPAKFGAWLWAIALRLCQSWHRRRRESPWPPEELARYADAGAEAFADSRARLLAREALETLPEAQRLTVAMKYLEGYSLTEIAALQAVPVETIRTRLRRARHRLKEVCTTMMEESSVPAPADAGFTRRVLERVETVETESGLVWPLYACLHSLGNDWSLAHLMGVTGTAFRFTVDARIGEQGPTDVLDWDRWFAMIRELGSDAKIFNAQLKSFSPTVRTNTEEEFHAAQAAAWDSVRASLDRGVPAVAWMPMTREQKAQGLCCELGLLVGYDTQVGVYHVRVPGRPIYTVPWDGFGRADPVNWFNVIVFGEPHPLDERELERKAVRYAVEHARSQHPGHGLGGYATWLAALESGQIQPSGSPGPARLLREAREHAARFLQEIAGHFSEAQGELAATAQEYGTVAQAWGEYVALFTPPSPYAMGDPAKKTAAVRIVSTAQAAERAAVAALERALPKLGAA
jgi:RNA polymerase sigma factor (sigma-70 family)